MLKAYSFSDGEPVDGAVLVFAHNFKQGKKIAYRSVQSWSGCEFTDVRGFQLRDDSWLKENAADQEKLKSGVPHVIDNPPCCKGCELWHTWLDDSGYCDTCGPNREFAPPQEQ